MLRVLLATLYSLRSYGSPLLPRPLPPVAGEGRVSKPGMCCRLLLLFIAPTVFIRQQYVAPFGAASAPGSCITT